MTKGTEGPTFELNVTPMLDVLLVLLIIFMAAVMQIHHTIDVTLPIPCGGTCNSNETPIVLEVFPGPTYRVNQKLIAPSELLGYLRGIYNGRPDKVIQVAGQPTVRYDDIVHAIDIAKSAGVHGVGIAPKEVSSR